MTLFHGGLLALFAVATAGALVWTWRERWLAERRAAERARHAAIQRVDDLAHDLSNLIGLIQINAVMASSVADEERDAVFDDLRHSAALLRGLFNELRGSLGNDGEDPSCEHVVRTLAGLIERTGVETRIEVDESFDLAGAAPIDFLRLTENLLVNAAREAARSGEPEVWLRMSSARVEVRNRLRDSSTVDPRIYESGVSRVGSTGRGLAIARASAEALDCALRHEVDGRYVCFTVERAQTEAMGQRRVGA